MVLSRKKLIKLIVAVVIGITFFSYVYSIRDGTINEDVKIYFHKISVYIKDVLKPKTKTLVQKSVLKEESMRGLKGWKDCSLTGLFGKERKMIKIK